MVRIVEVQKNDCLIKIIESEKGIKGVAAYQWVKKVQELNPHIGNIDMIHPKERILIPDTLQETISPKVIWENALSQMPASMNVRPPLADEAFVYITKAGDCINIIAEKMFANSPCHTMTHSAKRAILLHNNPKLLSYLNGSLPIGTLVNLTTFKLTDYELRQWEHTHSDIKSELESVDNNVKLTFHDTDLQTLYMIANNVKEISSVDSFAAGLDDNVRFNSLKSAENTGIKDKIVVTGRNAITATGYGIGAGSAFAGSGTLTLAQSNALLQEVYQDAYKKFGENILRKPHTHMSKLESFLNSHPKWNELMKNVKKLPNLLLPKKQLRPKFNYRTKFPNANMFKNHIVKVNLNPNIHSYSRSLSRSLNGKISIFKGWGGRLTWGLPIILGGISVALAPSEQRVKTIFKEGFSVVFGAAGTFIGGTAVGLTAAGVSLLFGICISPVGIFIAGFLLGGYLGYKLSKVGKGFGGSVYEGLMAQGRSGIYHSMNQYVESIY
jgi:hypothetical protein